MKEYEIKYEPILLPSGVIKQVYNIYYYINNEQVTKEFHSYDGITGEIRENFKLKTQI